MLRKLLLAAVAATLANDAGAQPSSNSGFDPDKQAAALVKQMTPDERNLLLHGFFSRPNPVNKLPQIGAPFAAGYTPGIARLGIPGLAESDASLGVAWINGKRARNATALPSSLALAATWARRSASWLRATWSASNALPSWIARNDSPAFESRRVRIQPSIVTLVPTGT